MKHLIRMALVAAMSVALAGCEWSGGGGDGGGSWSSRYNFVNFSGSYRGSPLVSAYSASSGGGTTADGVTYVNQSETQTRNIQLQTVVDGKLSYPPVVPGSVSITGSGTLSGFGVGFSVTDDGNGNLTGSSFKVPNGASVSVSGKIVYTTGAWFISLNGGGQYTTSMEFRENYSQSVTTAGTSGSSATPGSSKVTIYAFNVEQEGNKLRIVDNNGATYEGSFGSIRTTGGTDQDSTTQTFNSGDQVMATFAASGTSKSGVGVKMTGTFQAVLSGVSSSSSGTTTMTLGNRQILGTWIEDGGATGDINGTAASVSASTTSTTTP